LASLFRAMTAGILAQVHRRGLALRPTLLIGAGGQVRTLAEKIRQHPDLGLGVVSMVSPGRPASDLPELIDRWSVREIIVVAEDADPTALAACLEACDGSPARVSIVPPLGQFLMDPRRVEHIGGVPVIVVGRVSRAARVSPAKRAVDLLIAGLVTLALAPVMLLVAALIKLDSRGPVLFRQLRIGHGGNPFAMLKFRSMVEGADGMVIDLAGSNESDGLLFKMKDDPRVTRVGKLIRKLSIDELPQLLNVLRGEMSLVGPRPLPVSADSFGPVDGKRHNARPGITGLWQTSGRSHLGYEEMIKLDLAYIQHWSVWTDIQILLRTIPAVARGEGAF
jgi:exopolysaccharide biosynthesis polyprenyl glycosylphosphotransferase